MISIYDCVVSRQQIKEEFLGWPERLRRKIVELNYNDVLWKTILIFIPAIILGCIYMLVEFLEEVLSDFCSKKNNAYYYTYDEIAERKKIKNGI